MNVFSGVDERIPLLGHKFIDVQRRTPKTVMKVIAVTNHKQIRYIDKKISVRYS